MRIVVKNRVSGSVGMFVADEGDHIVVYHKGREKKWVRRNCTISRTDVIGRSTIASDNFVLMRNEDDFPNFSDWVSDGQRHYLRSLAEYEKYSIYNDRMYERVIIVEQPSGSLLFWYKYNTYIKGSDIQKYPNVTILRETEDVTRTSFISWGNLPLPLNRPVLHPVKSIYKTHYIDILYDVIQDEYIVTDFDSHIIKTAHDCEMFTFRYRLKSRSFETNIEADKVVFVDKPGIIRVYCRDNSNQFYGQ